MNLFKLLNRFEKKIKSVPVGPYYGSSANELENFFCGIGKAEISASTITFTNYPFEPSLVYPNKSIKAEHITAICLEAYPPLVRINEEVVFISKEQAADLKTFLEDNSIPTFKPSRNWDWLLEPFVDTAHTKEEEQRIIDLLVKNGVTESEINNIRKEVEKQMLKYNFDTMLWDWAGLGLLDVLSAMRVKYGKEQFADFYQRAMEIELRGAK